MSSNATIVVHVEGNRKEARACLDALAALHPEPKHDTIVIDDATMGLEGLFDHLPGDVEVLRNENREGLVASAVRASRHTGSDVLVLLQGLPELSPGSLGPMVTALADPALAAAAASLPAQPDSHPACTRALALRRRDAESLTRVVGTQPGIELAAICVELSSQGRVSTLAGSVAGPPCPRGPSARGRLGETPELTVVIPTLDAASDRVRACVTAIQARTDSPHQIVLVDNGAPPQGFTAPVNAGLRSVNTPYAVVMNDDVELQPGWWPPLREALDAGAAVVFPLTDGTWVRTDFAAWCFALTRQTLDGFAHAPGEFFDPELRVWYQDTDLLTRLREVGRPPQLVRESHIRHGLSVTVESEDPELRAWISETVERDRATFHRKHPSTPVHAD